MTARRFLVAGSRTEPVFIEVCGHGAYVDPGRYRTRREAMAEAEALLDDGWRGVAVAEYGAIHAAWKMCKSVVRSHTLPSGRYWPTHYCGRHDLLDDDRCPEHSETGVQVDRPQVVEQLGFDLEASTLS
ncbi:hypothetical protein E1287_25730 [Actinomadura sp. KC06]|uniref:hypothetical protein n=1 Tax=Actinomadura sp. KC06 TaxID=2530369 RepID=UPI001045A06D|nr:hypothetical protein [Actinomadura sp. KC06]TDD31664.1 hypothetical protein E1287_25730 [Actinomadura sp. KC06]